MLGALTALLVCQLAGEVAARALGLPVPGPVVGMAILFAALVLRGGIPDPLRNTAAELLRHLSLLFVPAGVGVLSHFGRIGAEWPAIGAALVVSTLATIAVTGVVLGFLLRRDRR